MAFDTVARLVARNPITASALAGCVIGIVGYRLSRRQEECQPVFVIPIYRYPSALSPPIPVIPVYPYPSAPSPSTLASSEPAPSVPVPSES